MPSDTPHPGATGANARYIRGLLAGYHLPLVADTPEARAAHDQHLMDAVIALHPEDDFEARLAVQIVAMGVHADDALRSAGLAAADPMEVRRCRAQAVSLARQADSSLRTLRRIQADRDKALAAMHPSAMGRAGYWFHEVSVPAPAPQPAEAAPAPAPAELDEVELYAVIYPDRAARIRAAGGLPPDLDFGPPEPHIVAGLLRTASASRVTRHNPDNRDSETESSHRPGRLPAAGATDPASELPMLKLTE
jgi:hypothetical protein